MSRSRISPLVATTQLAVIAIGVPLWAIIRLAKSPLPTRSSDIALLVALVCWAILAKAIVERDGALDSLTAGQGTAVWYAHGLVDQSIFGVGIVPGLGLAAAPLATVVAVPRDINPSELPSDLAGTGFGDAADHHVAGSRPRRATPILHVAEPERPTIVDTEEYIVGRGDTYWSVAEASLGDGREWKVLQELNLGREVAPGRALAEVDELRIGWSIQVPVLAYEEQG